ncbi:DUF721 domain-containing protein [Celerinatantimonas yamalensis]|uniref:DUF721 domain-containing protein n=1 Tax=Celerinatantimonas yamalensis TaxID=559956 RepID=A0ABW9G5M4_9GAMM
MSKRSHQPVDIDRLFANGQFAQFKQTTERRRLLMTNTEHILQRFHLQSCQLTQLDNGRAVISAPTAAWLNRLRQLKSQLLSELRTHYPGLISLELKINPQLASIKPEPLVKITTTRQISQQSAEHIRAAADHMPDELKERLERIAALCGEKNK